MSLIVFLDLFGTLIFALTGAIKGIDKHLDIFGITVFASIVGVGGGIFRDCCIGSIPVTAFINQYYLCICISTGIIVFLFRKLIHKYYIDDIITYLDAIGLSVFTSLGCLKALDYNMPFVGVVIAGVLTSIGGGLIRDVFAGELPPTVLKTDLYATASLLGGALCYSLFIFNLTNNLIFVITSSFVFLLRIFAIRLKLKLPTA